MEQIRIQTENIERIEAIRFPPGLKTKTAKANYAIGLGLDVMEGRIMPQQASPLTISDQDVSKDPKAQSARAG